MAGRRRDQLAFVAGWGISVAGDLFALTALTLAAHDVTRASWAVAAVLLAALAPTIAAAPLAGRLVDQHHPVEVVVVVALVQAVAVAALAWFAANLAVVLTLAVLLGLGATITRPATFVLVPRLVDADQITKTNARLQLGQYLGMAGGQAVGGLAVAGIGVTGALLVDAASFLVLAGLYRSLHAAVAAGGVAEPTAAAEAPGRGRWLGVLTANPVLLAALVVTGALLLFAGVTNVAEVFLAKDVLHAGDGGYGILLASWTAGVVAGLLLLASRLPNDQLLGGLLAAAATCGVATMVAGAAPTIVVAVVAYLVGGTANGVGQVAVRSLLHTQVPPGQQGQAFAAFGAVMSSAEITAMLAGGLLVGLVGARGAMLVDGTGMVTVAAAATVVLGVRGRGPLGRSRA
jgi:hypothetical protein